MASKNAKNEFIETFRKYPLSSELHKQFVEDTLIHNNENELLLLFGELTRVIEGLKCYCPNNVKPKKYYRINQPEDRQDINYSLRYDILKRDGFKCKLCGFGADDGVKLQIDHIIPFSKGGKTRQDNLRTLCIACNLGKKDKIE